MNLVTAIMVEGGNPGKLVKKSRVAGQIKGNVAQDL